jgi:hypothetical protein
MLDINQIADPEGDDKPETLARVNAKALTLPVISDRHDDQQEASDLLPSESDDRLSGETDAADNAATAVASDAEEALDAETETVGWYPMPEPSDEQLVSVKDIGRKTGAVVVPLRRGHSLPGEGDKTRTKRTSAKAKGGVPKKSGKAVDAKAKRTPKVKVEAAPEPEIDEAVVASVVVELARLDGDGLRVDIKRGDAFERLRDGARSENNYTRLFSRLKLGISVRQAHNLRVVAGRFGKEVDRWVAVGATHTHLRHIVNCPSEVVEDLYEEMAGGVRLTTRDFQERAKPFVEQPDRKAPDLGRVGGLSAMKAMARTAAVVNAAEFDTNVRMVIEILERNLGYKHDGGAKIAKGRTIEELTLPAGSAARLHEMCFAHFWALSFFDGHSRYRRFSAFGDRMTLLRCYLDKLIRSEDWSKDAGGWIAASVLPVLRWAVGDLNESEGPFDELIAAEKPGWLADLGYLPPSEEELQREEGYRQRARQDSASASAA